MFHLQINNVIYENVYLKSVTLTSVPRKKWMCSSGVHLFIYLPRLLREHDVLILAMAGKHYKPVSCFQHPNATHNVPGVYYFQPSEREATNPISSSRHLRRSLCTESV